MAKKSEIVFECASCGQESPKWLGRCPACGEWNSFRQMKQAPAPSAATGRIGLVGARGAAAGTGAAPTGGTAMVSPKPLGDITVEEGLRLSLGTGEFDRVLGGGMLRGSAVVLGGEPGIGKSTLMLQAARALAKNGPILYVAGEESGEQIKLRADRLGLAKSQRDIHLLASSHLVDIIQALAEVQPVFVIVDSVQTLFSPEAGSAPGSPNQIKYCVYLITEWCRQNYAAVMLIAHVTKEGIIAGPKLLEHMVDVVLYFEEAEAGLRVLRAAKNRYGSTDEIGLFSMGEKGLTEVLDPYAVLVEKREGQTPPGVVSAPIHEGSRILLVEIQALTVPNKAGISRVNSDRVDQRRVSRIAAVLEKQAGLSFSDQEIYVNIAGGLKVSEVALDLGLAMALFSARSGLPVPAMTAIAGEVSLAGEVRPVRHLKRRVQAARDLGFTTVLAPAGGATGEAGDAKTVRDIGEAIRLLFGKAAVARPAAPARDRSMED
jgi:DNA repair protein RadA/Sms